MSVSYPGESAEYRAARDRLLEQEAALRRLTEEVAAARRALPPGALVAEDYVFEEAGEDGTPRPRALSELFAPGHDSLAIYSFMFPGSPENDGPCASCTQFLDSFDRVVHHAGQRVSVAIVAKAPVDRLRAHAERRGWRNLRLLSAAGNTYQRDYLAETDGGAQLPMLNVFRRDGGEIRHAWGSELMYAPAEPGQDPRHNDTIDPLWNLFDFTPAGRGTDWFPALSYD
jgi:predicted dithiol-disulfide oxidoreductase (DUF899 family)